MGNDVTALERAFEEELDHFRDETNNAICFYCIPRAVAFAAADPAVRRALNQAALFWNVSATSSQVGLFVALGRIFDQSSPHNIDSLLRLASTCAVIFEKSALEVRKRVSGFTDAQALQEYLRQVYIPSADDFRILRRSTADLRRLYETHFRDIRNEYIAHRAVSSPSAVADLFSRAEIVAIETLLASLSALHHALQDLYQNGNAPVLRPRPMSIENLVATPIEAMNRQTTGELAVYETRRCLDQLVRGTQSGAPSRRW